MDELELLYAKAAELKRQRDWAQERREYFLQAYLTGNGTRQRFELWADKAGDIGVEYYETLDAIVELEDAVLAIVLERFLDEILA